MTHNFNDKNLTISGTETEKIRDFRTYGERCDNYSYLTTRRKEVEFSFTVLSTLSNISWRK